MCEGAGVWKNKRKLTALRLGLLLCALPHGEKPIKRRPSQAPTVPYKRPQRKPHDHYTTVTRPFHDRYMTVTRPLHLQSTQALDILAFWEGVKC